MEQQKKLNTVFWIKAFLWFLFIMFIFTVVSKAADSFTVAKVTVESPSARKIQYNVQIQGMVVKNREISILTQPDILVKSILADEGQHVKKGDVLAKLDMKSLDESINSIENEKKILTLQNEALLENFKQTQAQQNRAIARANEDLTWVRKQNEAAISLAENELLRTERDLEKQRLRLNKIQQNLEDAKKKGKDTSNIVAKKKEQKSIIASLKDTVLEKKKAVKAAKQTKKAEEKEAGRAVEDANAGYSSDNTIDINNISIKNYNIQLKKLNRLKEQKGKIFAPESGTITALLITVGQKTPDTAVITMTDDSAGLKFMGQMDAEDVKYVSIGDTASLKSTGKNADDIRIISIEPDTDKRLMNVTAMLPAKKFSLGESAVMEVVQSSDNYNCTVPVSAVYREDGKNYVLIATEENTVMGSQYIARKVEVEVLEQNNLYAALDQSALENDSQIITNTDRYVKAGDRIRKNEDIT